MTTEYVATCKFYLMSWHKVALHQPFSVKLILRSSLAPYMMLYDVNVINIVTSDSEYRLHEQVRNIMAHYPARLDSEYRQPEQAWYLLGRPSHG
jgi:ketopantoate reductase